MALTLEVRREDVGELPVITFDLPRLIIGRGESCDLRLPDPSVSLNHASIRQRGSDYIIVDEASTNGTFVGPVRLAPQAPRVLRSGDRIRVGRIWIEVRLESGAPTAHPQFATKDLALQLVAKSLNAQGEAAIPKLVVSEGQNIGTELILEEQDHRYVLGRSATADLVLLETNASRRHVEVWRQGASVMLRELAIKKRFQVRLILHSARQRNGLAERSHLRNRRRAHSLDGPDSRSFARDEPGCRRSSLRIGAR